MVVDLSMVILHAHPLYHPHEPPFVHDSNRDHLPHHVVFASVVLELLLPIVAIYFFLVSFATTISSFTTPMY
jgi:hypothetical protein